VKPRVRFGAETTALEEVEIQASGIPAGSGAVASSVDAQRLAQHVLRSPFPAEADDSSPVSASPDSNHHLPTVEPSASTPEAPRARVSRPASPPRAAPAAIEAREDATPRESADDSAVRREKLRSRLRSLSSGGTLRQSGNPEAVLAAAEDLVQQLASGRATIARLEADLRGARRDLEHSVAEAERSRNEGETLRAELGEARGLLGTLETELTALEAERDEVLYEVRRLREAEAARSESLASMSRELDEARRDIGEIQSEQAEILNELQQSDAERTALKAEVQRLEKERARSLQEIEATAVAEGELREQRGTLSRVHQVLAAARER
jgi:predicted  nucleic acid-binding Zn-ribbon protein